MAPDRSSCASTRCPGSARTQRVAAALARRACCWGGVDQIEARVGSGRALQDEKQALVVGDVAGGDRPVEGRHCRAGGHFEDDIGARRGRRGLGRAPRRRWPPPRLPAQVLGLAVTRPSVKRRCRQRVHLFRLLYGLGTDSRHGRRPQGAASDVLQAPADRVRCRRKREDEGRPKRPMGRAAKRRAPRCSSTSGSGGGSAPRPACGHPRGGLTRLPIPGQPRPGQGLAPAPAAIAETGLSPRRSLREWVSRTCRSSSMPREMRR